MLLVVGLGNPGEEYADTRHNVGFMAVDEIVRRHSFSPFKDKFKGMISGGVIAGKKVIVLKPSTYMNLSGESVLSAMSFYKIKPENVFVIHDDLDLPVAKVKVKQGGGSGGHNGLKSIDSCVGNNYWRVRIGIDKPVFKGDVVDWVLHDFSAEERTQIDKIISLVSDNISLLLSGHDQTFLNHVIKK